MNRLSVVNPWNWIVSPWEGIDEDDISFSQILPPMDIVDEGEKLSVRVQIPGYTKEMVKISVEGNKLTITGTMKKDEKQEDKKKYYKKEIHSQSTFTRSCILPSDVDSTGATAEFKDGELHIFLPKIEKAQPKSIPIA
ncbi:MAG TPA: Hsp20/alpha crystallin family protein [Candidatus Dojkabacteria bacterium]|nr:Hsp20/alpha crystallin family protein [Candidatus Dojkabacteria bacterium]HQF36216.1 Hsp20/alpha crystallin family protein [Candidatus Dojkabacteria bacterium]